MYLELRKQRLTGLYIRQHFPNRRSCARYIMASSSDVRCCARVIRNSDGRSTGANLFIAGNALELVPIGSTEGEQHVFTRVYDEHASDKDIYEGEVLTLIEALVGGSNACNVTMGHHRGGHSALCSSLAPLCAEMIFDLMKSKQAAAGGRGERLSYTLHASVVSAMLGSFDKMSDMLAPGSTELRVVRDAEAPNGVSMPGIRKQQLSSGAEFAKMFLTAHARLASHYKEPLPSTVILFELKQSWQGSAADLGVQELLSTLIFADIEVDSFGFAYGHAPIPGLRA